MQICRRDAQQEVRLSLAVLATSNLSLWCLQQVRVLKKVILNTMVGVAAANDDYTVRTHVMPIPRFGTMKDKATVVEMLELHWFLATENMSDLGATHWAFLASNTTRSDGETSTLATMQQDIERSGNFGITSHHNLLLTSGALSHHMPLIINLTDHAGNGMLYPYDELDVIQGDVGAATVHSSTVRILYRLVNVGIEEYVGITAQRQ